MTISRNGPVATPDSPLRNKARTQITQPGDDRERPRGVESSFQKLIANGGFQRHGLIRAAPAAPAPSDARGAVLFDGSVCAGPNADRRCTRGRSRPPRPLEIRAVLRT